MTHSYRLVDGPLWQKLVFGGGLVAFAVLGWIRVVQWASGLAFFPLLVLLPVVAFAFRGIWSKQPALTLDSTGIRFKSWKRDDPLPWQQIQKIKLLTLGPGEPFIGLFLLEEAPHGIPKHVLRVSQLNVSTNAFYAVSLNYWSKFGPSALSRQAG